MSKPHRLRSIKFSNYIVSRKRDTRQRFTMTVEILNIAISNISTANEAIDIRLQWLILIPVEIVAWGFFLCS